MKPPGEHITRHGGFTRVTRTMDEELRCGAAREPAQAVASLFDDSPVRFPAVDGLPDGPYVANATGSHPVLTIYAIVAHGGEMREM